MNFREIENRLPHPNPSPEGRKVFNPSPYGKGGVREYEYA